MKTKRADGEAGVFISCGMCKHTWTTRDDFLSDPNIELLGYMANFDDRELGHFCIFV